MNHVELSAIAAYVDERISSDAVSLGSFVTTDSLLQNKEGRGEARKLPPNRVPLTRYRPGDVLIANIRPYLRKIWQADCWGGCSTDVLVFRALPHHSPDFLYSVLLQDSFFDHAMEGKKGAKMPRGDKNQIMRFLVPNISEDEEAHIGRMIASISQKMKFNRKLNHNLEAMAQALYDYWFVQFDFPDENGRPYKSSGGKMLWNEQLKREIPEGWKSAMIQEMADVIGGSTPSTLDPDNFSQTEDSGIPWITPKDLSRTTDLYISRGELSITEKGRKEAALSYLPPGSILFSSRAPIGYVAISSNYVTTNQGFKSLAPLDPVSTSYLFFLMRSLVPFFIQSAGITTFKEVSGGLVKSTKIVRPPQTLLQSFFEITNPIFNKRRTYELEIKKLTKLRDFLLPLLMNGQVQVRPQGELNYDLASD